jgi:hypothetical protein
MSNEALVSNQINSVINNLADKLHVPINEIMGALMMQAKISSISDILSMILISTIFYLSLRIFLKENAKPLKKHDCYCISDHDTTWWISMISLITFGVIFALFTISFAMSLSITMAGFFNPKYWALSQVFGLLK